HRKLPAGYHALTEVEKGRFEFKAIKPVMTPYGETQVAEHQGRIVHIRPFEGTKYEVVPLDNGGFIYVDEAGKQHRGAIESKEGVVTVWGKAQRMQTPFGLAAVLLPWAHDPKRAYVVLRENDTIRLEHFIPTPYGFAKLEHVAGSVEAGIRIDGESYRVEKH